MDNIYAFFGILAVCLAGSVYTSYKAGIRDGAENMLMVLSDIGLIDIDQDGNISAASKK